LAPDSVSLTSSQWVSEGTMLQSERVEGKTPTVPLPLWEGPLFFFLFCMTRFE
jgi:hypothetical protein